MRTRKKTRIKLWANDGSCEDIYKILPKWNKWNRTVIENFNTVLVEKKNDQQRKTKVEKSSALCWLERLDVRQMNSHAVTSNESSLLKSNFQTSSTNLGQFKIEKKSHPTNWKRFRLVWKWAKAHSVAKNIFHLPKRTPANKALT